MAKAGDKVAKIKILQIYFDDQNPKNDNDAYNVSNLL